MRLFAETLRRAHILRIPGTIFLNNAIRHGLAMVVSVLVARIYGPTGRGEYALFTSLVPTIGLVSSLGLVNALVYHTKLGRLQVGQAVAILIGHSAVAASTVVSVGAAASALLPGWFSRSGISLDGWSFSPLIIMSLALAYGLTSMLNLFLTSYLLAIGDTRTHRMQMILIPLIILLLVLCLGVLLRLDGFHPITALVIAESVVAGKLLVRLVDTSTPLIVSSQHLGIIYSYALRSYISGLTGTIQSKLDNLVLGFFWGVETLGIYAAAKSFYQILMSIPQAFSGYLFGLFTERTGGQGLRLLFAASGAILFAMVVIVGPLVFFAPWLLENIYGKDFIPASTAMTILLPAAIIFGATSPALGFLLANDRPGIASTFSAISGVATTAALFLLVPQNSFLGAAYSTLLGACVMATLRVAFVGHKLNTTIHK